MSGLKTWDGTQWVAAASAHQHDQYLQLIGGTMTGFLTLNADPTQPLHAVTKQYVDAADDSQHTISPTAPSNPSVGDVWVNPDFIPEGVYLPLDGSLPMSGDLDMGGNKVVNSSVAWGVLDWAQRTSNFNNLTDVTFSNFATADLGANRRIKVTVQALLQSDAAALNDVYILKNLSTIQRWQWSPTASGQRMGCAMSVIFETTTAEVGVEFKVKMTSSVTMDLLASSTYPLQIIVEDVGPV